MGAQAILAQEHLHSSPVLTVLKAFACGWKLFAFCENFANWELIHSCNSHDGQQC